jgi:3-phenylpropionate/trans-cinnamate dioxygenase ferredoxin subunit
MDGFVAAASVEDVPPGERIVVQVGKTWIALFNVNGEFHAVEDLCTHDEGPLGDGPVIGCEVECPRHGARFDLRDGRVTAPPALVPIPVHATRVEDGTVYIAVAQKR